MKELVKITEKNGKKTVGARHLHQLLKSGYQFTDWFEYRKNQYDLVEGIDYQNLSEISVKPGKNQNETKQFTEISVKLGKRIQGAANQIFSEISEKIGRGRPSTDYDLTLDCAKELAMIENNAEGKKVRRYFLEIEKRYGEIMQPIGNVVKVYPLAYKGQVGFPRRELLLISGYSPNSGTISTLKKKYPEHFFTIMRTACVSAEFARFRYEQGKVRQLEIDFRESCKAIGGRGHE